MASEAPRIALIHALAHSVAPINDAMARDWPQARRMNLLDDSLSEDLAASTHGLDDAMQRRFSALARYAVDCGCDAILFTCSAFGPCIEQVAREHPSMPVLKPNEAMIEDVCAISRRIGLVATFAPTLASMPAEFPRGADLHVALAEGALQALNAGDIATHNRLVARAAQQLAGAGCQAIALAQFSMACAADAVAKQTGLPVFTTVTSAVAKLRRLSDALR
jgi:aspartate/glutamate racemase